ncbi:hypothetical protein BSKO_08988 [Bryopsis sp. KO-2023]|nr:hypothetical protein BSKO_08988 [Bryopsis sp. KO-2023]
MFPERHRGDGGGANCSFGAGNGMNAGGRGRLVGGKKRESVDFAGGAYFTGGQEPFDLTRAHVQHNPESGLLTGSYVVDTNRPPQEKRRKFAASPSHVLAQGKPLLVVRRGEMLSNLTHVIGKYVGCLTGTGKGLSLASLRDAFQATFSYPLTVEGMAGHNDLPKFLREQFSASLQVRCDDRGNHWVYPIEPPAPIGPVAAVVCKDVKSAGREALVRMVSSRKVTEAKFRRWKAMRDIMVASGQPLPSLENLLGIRPERATEKDFSQSLVEETGSSQGRVGQAEERIGYHLPHFVSEFAKMFPSFQMDTDSHMRILENHPKLCVKSDSAGEKYIEEREPSVDDLKFLLDLRKSIAEMLLEPSNGFSKRVHSSSIVSRLGDKGEEHALNPLGFTDLGHLLRNNTMFDILTGKHDKAKGRQERVWDVVLDPLLNVRNFLEGRMSALLNLDPMGTLPFSVLRNDFEKMFHKLHPEALGLKSFEAGECPYLKDICKVVAGCSNELFLCPTLLCKFKWMICKFVSGAPILTGNEEHIPGGGVSLLQITERFLEIFRTAATLGDLGYDTWESLLNDFRDVCTYVKSDDDCIIVLFRPSQEMKSPFLQQSRNLFTVSQNNCGQQGMAPANPNSRSSSSTPVSHSNLASDVAGSAQQHTPNFTRHSNPPAPTPNIGNLASTPPIESRPRSDMRNSARPLQIDWLARTSKRENVLQWVHNLSQFQAVADQGPDLSGKVGKIWMSCWEMLGTMLETPQVSSSADTTCPVSSLTNSQGEVCVQAQSAGGLSGSGVEMF